MIQFLKSFSIPFIFTLSSFCVFYQETSLEAHADSNHRAGTPILLGLEHLIKENPNLIQGKKVGIIGNHTSRDSQGNGLVSLLKQHATISALFGPEHGFGGDQSAGDTVESTLHQGIPLYSLYSNYRTPTASMLQGIDVLIYDMQDVGVRFYTYISSLYLALSAAAQHRIPILVLDRPNPIDATRVEGSILNPAYASYVGVMPLPIRYGMTIGELAKLMNEETYAGFSPNADLTVVRMENYRRDMWYDDTGLPWIAPSPNMPTLDTAIVYPGTCLFEGSNLSEGRGTDAPFLTLGAPFIDADAWLSKIPADVRKGIDLKPIRFTPKSIPGKAENPKFKDKTCNGLSLTVADRKIIKPIDLAIALLGAAHTLYPDQITLTPHLDRLWGDESLRSMLEEGADSSTILDTIKTGLERFEKVRTKYLLYP